MDTLTSEQFGRIADTAMRRWGLALSPRKLELVASRLTRHLRTLPFTSIDAFLAHLDATSNEADLLALFDVLSTNYTGFFREPAAFAWLERELWTPLARGTLTVPQRRVRIWSAACSTGQEPGSLAMQARETLGDGDWDVRILASDLATSVLRRAKAGLYDVDAMEGVDEARRSRWFDREAEGWRISPSLRRLITYRRVNLVDPLPFRGPFDAIFCRNVMIYFDQPTRQQVVDSLARLLRPGGALVVGSAESLSGIETELRPVQPSVYVR